ncbi:tRNA (adenosine(37)-N6)-threonylcarbamoyltransferase complex transferase subunit TsaD [Ghiorsea bivora]|uniref:tRNA (adenosine(37)-N6)-threonylcarbamoyltransferase complex transferase subunit TsaD n=1 Tax=Ghiorsea bivora TaxID=1485545 RepID=UPI0005705797|nr:tRNA (adenosine(37)-N6)-threonylcarbamoyltransferase complex transferase subunit TsaD [Ghiorsea bivora]
MRVLGIESSCDETAVAIYAHDKGIIAEAVASQIETHAKFGGVVPEVASREHLKVLPALTQQVLADAGCDWSSIDGIAVTAGPGLMGALLVGVTFARSVGLVNNIPVLPVHHMEGHLFAPGLSDEGLPAFPFMSLLVSGGHTLLIRVDGLGQYKVIGQTIDDAAGECFDKAARVLGLPYPGGPEIAKLAKRGDASVFKLPRPMLNKANFNFSFSGLKTAVMYAAKGCTNFDAQAKADLAAATELAIADVLVKKAMRACKAEDITTLVIAGGVAANQTLRMTLDKASKAQDINVFVPDLAYCTDNAAMIAYAGALRFQQNDKITNDWDANPRWKLTDLT